MFYHQTIFEYIDNPMGKGSTAIANRGLIREDLNRRYDKLIEKHRDFYCKKHFDGKTFYYHIKIPSETKRENDYDVVIELSDPLGNFTRDITLNRYVMRVFSNCPSFVFTYAHTFNRYGMLIPELKSKYTDVVLSQEPSIKNPGNIINYEKSIYFACRYLSLHKSLLNKVTLATTNSIGLKKEFEKIRTSDKILLEIKRENNKLSKKNTEDKKKENKKQPKEDSIRKKPVNKTSGTHRITPHSKMNKVKPTKKIK